MHGGDRRRLAFHCGKTADDLLDFSANINPLGPPPSLRQALRRGLRQLTHYPEPEAATLTEAIAASLHLPPEQVVVGNGTAELLCALPGILHPRRVLLPVPCYVDYASVCARAGLEIVAIPLDASGQFQPRADVLAKALRPGDLLIIGQPNNPTGRMLPRDDLLKLARSQPTATLLVDEAFAGFVPDYRSIAGCSPNMLALVSLTKLYAIPGLRLGYLAGHPSVVQALRQELPPWNVNAMAQEAGLALLAEIDYVQRTRQQVTRLRRQLFTALTSLPELEVVPGEANFLLVRLESPRHDAVTLAKQLLHNHAIAIRVCEEYQGLDRHYFRVAVRTAGENRRLLDALRKELPAAGHLKSALLQDSADKALRPASMTVPVRSPLRHPPALMLLGTGSDVGKSILTAAFCRIFLQDGLRVAPFKAQNMSLNSHVTRDGGEMGRAQVVQAQACRLDPDVRMNPILLKPSSDTGCQVIVHGRPLANLMVRDYIARKATLWHEVCSAYDELAGDYDLMVLEGAGSCGEVNLRAHDIVNMRMADYAGARALLVGDIDRGGVYASIVGHVEVMEPWEKRLLDGFLINRFRGDAALLAPAHDFIRQRTGLPVLGVIAHLDGLALPQEDSVAFRAGVYQRLPSEERQVEVAVIDLPHIANFTDLEPLLIEQDIALRVVRAAGQLGRPAAVILPGSKNVMHDLHWLQRSGLATELMQLVGKGVELVGICGGYQILGQEIDDPHGLEAQTPGMRAAGLGLLPMRSTLEPDKLLRLRRGIHLSSGEDVRGYEIHHGRSRESAGEPLLRFDDGDTCGRATSAHLVWGTYLHGLFDADGFRRWWIDRLRRRLGLNPLGRVTATYDIEPVLDRLADAVRASVDLPAIRRLLGIA